MPSVNLSDVIKEGRTGWVLSGKVYGTEVRKKLDLDKLDESPEAVNVIMPNKLEEITPSFVLGLFSKSFEHFSKSEDEKALTDAFFNHYRIEGPQAVVSDIKDGIKDYFTILAARRHLASRPTERDG